MLVGRPMQVAMVNGLKRKAAAMAKLVHLLSFLGEVKNLEFPASPDSAILIKEFALQRSSNTYSRYVTAGYIEELGRRENRGRNNGA